MQWIRKVTKMLFYENDSLSFTRILAALGYILFALVSIYLVLKGQTWTNYETFASFTGGGGIATQVSNKFINSKYNSVSGGYGQNKTESTGNNGQLPAPEIKKS